MDTNIRQDAYDQIKYKIILTSTIFLVKRFPKKRFHPHST